MGDSVAQKNRAGQVVTRRARSLLGAADSRRHKSEPEDRLTEILREVLMTAPALASWLVEKAFELSPEDAKRCCAYGDFEVSTQVALRGGGRPDVQIRFAGEHRPPGQLFCENKIRAGWTVWRRLGYPAVHSRAASSSYPAWAFFRPAYPKTKGANSFRSGGTTWRGRRTGSEDCGGESTGVPRR